MNDKILLKSSKPEHPQPPLSNQGTTGVLSQAGSLITQMSNGMSGIRRPERKDNFKKKETKKLDNSVESLFA